MRELTGKYTYFLTISLIIFIGFLLRLKIFYDNPSFWFDESALGFNVLELNFKDFFGILHLQQVTPPLFLVISKFLTKIFGAGDMNLRLLPFIIANLNMLLFMFLLQVLYKNKFAIITGLVLFCLNSQMIKYSVEFKPYIAEVFTTCLILYIFTKFKFDWSYKKIVIVGLFLAILPWFTFISAVALPIAFILIFSQKNYKKWLLFVSPSFVSIVAFVMYYLKVNAFYSGFMTDFFENDFFNLGNFFINFLSTINFLFNLQFSLFPLLIIFAGIIYCLIVKKSDYAVNFSILMILSAIILSILHKYPFFNRFVLYLYPLYLIIMLFIFEKLYDCKNRFINLIAILLTTILLLPSGAYIKKITSESITKRDCARELMFIMSETIKPNEEIIVDTLSTPDFLYYNKYFSLRNKVYFNFEVKNGKILYKYDKNKVLPIKKEHKYWFYSPWRSGIYNNLKYDYKNICSDGGQLIYIDGDKQ